MRKVIVTREDPISEELKIELLKNEFFPCHLPLIQCSPFELQKNIVDSINHADWIFLTSARAFEFFYPYMLRELKIATVGPATSQAVRKKGFEIDFEASQHYACDFVKEWLSHGFSKQTILLPQSSLSNPVLAKLLSDAGHEVISWALYGTSFNEESQRKISSLVKESGVIWTFASPSAWNSFIDGGGVITLDQEIAVIGKSTSQAITANGYEVTYMPDEPAIERMMHEIIHKSQNIETYVNKLI